ncbi:MAG: hypothetical protein CMF39_00155 [Legionellaceae bacterium]|nr:hypothetical protein [Legionellaceae bacterium]
MRKMIVLGILFICLGSLYQCKEKESNQVLTKEVKFQKEGELTLRKAQNDSVLVQLDIEISKGEYETQTGLMYRSSMENNRGMLFIFEDERPRYFYMKNTQFALDIIYVNGNGEVVSIQKDAQPLNQTSLPSEGPAQYVLEVNAGLSDLWNLEKGDIMDFTRL